MKRFRVSTASALIALAILAATLGAPALAAGPTHVSGTISTNTQWTLANSPYVLDAATTVAAGVTLTIDPGVVVKGTIAPDRRLEVNGTLSADARSGARITFTSYYDDSAGGDTNGDGTATHAAAGNWGGVIMRAGSSGTLGNVEIRYAGWYDPTGTGANADLYVNSSTVTLASSTITASSNAGLLVDGSTTPAITGNTFTSNQGWPLRTTNLNSTQNVHGNTVGAGNRYNGMYIGGSASLTVDLTWDETQYAFVGDQVIVPLGRTLTIKPGVVYKSSVSSPARFDVSGTLVAGQAAPAAKTYFTSYYDDSVGGDTNGDGTATTPAAGQWGGIAYRAGSSGSLTNVDVAYGGWYDWTGTGAQSDVYINASSVTIAGSTIRRSSYRGIYVEGVTPDIGTSTISSNGNTGVRLGGSPTPVHDNTLSNNGNFVIEAFGANSTAALARNTGTGNTHQAVYVTGTLSQNATWESTFPWVIDGPVVVNAGATLTLNPGVVVKGAQASNRYLDVSGTLTASGTSGSHIVFTAYRDDTAGGDTNGDGSASAPARGDWGGVFLRAGSTGTLAYVDIRYAGWYDPTGTGLNADLYVNSSTVSLTHATIASSSNAGLLIDGANTPTINGNTFSSNATWALRTTNLNSTLNVHGNTVNANNGNSGLYIGPPNALTVDLTWDETQYPYVGDVVTVPAGRTLTIKGGVVYKSGIGSSERFDVSGTLIAGQAAPAPRATFTSYYDDTQGGDTNGDGTTTVPNNSQWAGIGYRAGSSGSLTNVDLAYAGWYDWTGTGRASNLYIATNGVTVLASTVRRSGAKGIFVDSGATPEIGTSTVTANAGTGIHLEGGAASVHDNTITNNGGYGIEASGANATAALARNTETGNTYQANYVTGTLSTNATWEASTPWVIDSTITINAGVTLTIQPGAVIKGGLAPDRYFNVLGTLNATGTSGAHIVFTAYRDDSAGGDTNGDGTASTPAAGSWGGIAFRAGSSGSLVYTDVRYGGWFDYTGYGVGSLVYLASSGVTLDHGALSYSSTSGVLFENTGVTPTVTNNTITHITGWPISYLSPNSTAGTVSGNTVNTSGANGARLGGTLTVNAAWHDNPVYVVDSLVVGAGTTLTIDPGRVVKFTQASGSRLDVSGSLHASGTAGNPIVFTAFTDDSAGGDTNADGTASSPAMPSWAGIGLRATSTGDQLTYAQVRYAGWYDWSGYAVQSSVYVNTSSAVVDHVTVTNSYGTPLLVDSGTTPQLTYNALNNHPTTSAIKLTSIASANVSMHDNTSTGNYNYVYIPNSTLAAATSATLAETLPYVYDYLFINGTLNVNPGTILKATANYDRRFEVAGTLFTGSSTNNAKVVFTSYLDDAVGGDSNADGTATAPAAGGWAGLAFRAGNTGSILYNTEVHYAGGMDWSGYATNAGIFVANGSPKFSNLVVTDSSSYGMWFFGAGSPDVGACNMARNATRDFGFSAVSGLTPSIHDCTNVGSVWYVGNGPHASFKNDVFNSWGAKQSRVAVDDVGAITDATNTINAVTGATLEVWPGITAYDQTWGPAAGVIVPQGYVDIQGADGADALTTITLAPGTTVKFIHNGAAGFRAGVSGATPPGALVADALAAARIVLTSSDAVPNPGAWQGVQILRTGRGTLRNVIIQYADTGLTVNAGTASVLDTLQLDRCTNGLSFVGALTPATFTGVTTSNDTVGVISNTSTPVFRNSQLLGSSYGVRNDTPAQVVDARQNWWGDPSGPGPVGPGTGAKITTGVLYDQFENAPADDGDGVPLHAGPAPNPCTCGNKVNCDDNCAATPNPSQADADCDGVGDACDTNPTITVSSDPNDHADYAKIEDAINAAYQSGTSILIFPGLGPYVENARADRYMQFSFSGKTGAGPVIVDGGANPAFYVQNKVGSNPTRFADLTLRGYDGIQALVDTEISRVTIDGVTYRGFDLNGGTHSIADAFIGPVAPTGIAVANGATLTADRLTIQGSTNAGLLSAGHVTLSDSLIVGGLSGDAVRSQSGGSTTLRFVTIAGNTGAGINGAAGGTVAVTDSIVYGNSGGDLVGVACASLTRTDVGSVDCSAANANLHANPQLAADFHLLSGSPCLDYGQSPNTYHEDPPYDRAGAPRLLDWDGDGYARTDCGAYENTNAALSPGEVLGVVWTTKTRMTWSATPLAVRYHVYRDLSGNLSYANYGACRDDLDPIRTDTQLDDSGLPAAGQGFYYLVTAVNAAGHQGTLGLGTHAERSNYNACP